MFTWIRSDLHFQLIFDRLFPVHNDKQLHSLNSSSENVVDTKAGFRHHITVKKKLQRLKEYVVQHQPTKHSRNQQQKGTSAACYVNVKCAPQQSNKFSTTLHPLMQHFTLLSRLRNDLYCVGWGVKLYSLTHSHYYAACLDSRIG